MRGSRAGHKNLNIDKGGTRTLGHIRIHQSVILENCLLTTLVSEPGCFVKVTLTWRHNQLGHLALLNSAASWVYIAPVWPSHLLHLPCFQAANRWKLQKRLLFLRLAPEAVGGVELNFKFLLDSDRKWPISVDLLASRPRVDDGQLTSSGFGQDHRPRSRRAGRTAGRVAACLLPYVGRVLGRRCLKLALQRITRGPVSAGGGKTWMRRTGASPAGSHVAAYTDGGA